MNSNNLKLVLYFAMLGVVTLGGFGLLFDGNDLNNDAAYGMLGLIVGLLTREGAAILSASQVAAIAAAAPTVTTSAGPPATTTVTPPKDVG
jgi:hypothetical protein